MCAFTPLANAFAFVPVVTTSRVGLSSFTSRPESACSMRRRIARSCLHQTPRASTVPSTSRRTAVRSLHTAASLSAYLVTQRVAAIALSRASVPFPAPLAAMLFLLAATLVLRGLDADHLVDKAVNAIYVPAGTLLGRWLAVFFVPNLVMLPLAPALPRADFLKIVFIVVAGFATSLVSSAAVSLGIKSAVIAVRNGAPLKEVVSTPTKSVVPSDKLILTLSAIATVSLVLATAVSRLEFSSSVPALISLMPARVYALVVTLLTFSTGQRFGKRVKALLHPLVTCTIGTIVGMWILGFATGTSFFGALANYYVRGGTATSWGGGNILAGLLGPAVISFALQMDARRHLLFGRFMEITGTSLFASVFGLFGTAWLARMLKASSNVRLMVLPRMITAPLAIPIAEILGAPVAMAASIVAVTGLLGASIAISSLNALRIKDPVARGLAAGTSAHGLGTAAMADEPSAFPFAALSMALVGIFSTLLVAAPPVRALLLRVALGSVKHLPKVAA